MIIGIGGRRVCLWGYKGVHMEGWGAYGVIRGVCEAQYFSSSN